MSVRSYKIQKIDCKLYVKGFSGAMVYWALYGVLGSLGLFVLLYILAGTFVAVGICVPAFFICMYLITRIQKNYGHQGWQKRRIARQLPLFISIKKRICKVA